MKKQKKQRVISIALAIFLIAVVFISFAQFSYKIQRNNSEYAESTLNEIVALQKISIYSRFISDMTLLQNIASLIEAEQLTFEEVVNFIQKSNIGHNFCQIAIFNSDGRVATSDNSISIVSFDDIKTQFSTKESIYNTPFESSGIDSYSLSMSYPVYSDGKDEVSFVLVGVLTLHELQSYIENTFNENGNIGVLTSGGELVFSNQLTKFDLEIRENYVENLFNAIDARITADEFIDDLKELSSGSFIYNYLENEIYFAYEPLGINDWFIIVHLNKSSLISNADLVSRDAFGFLLTLIICMIILSAYIFYINKQVRKELYTLAYFDKLTKLPNGEHFKLDINKIISKYPDRSFYCIVFDICNFKLVNDRFGYAVGDKVLLAVSEIMKEAMNRKFGSGLINFAKLHSDTFVMFCPETSVEDCEKDMAVLTKSFNAATSFIKEYKMDFSLGRYVTQKGDNATTILEKALSAHSHSKRIPPNQFVDYDDLFINNLHNRADILNSFDDAIKNNEFEIFLQPQFCAKTRQIHGAEILVRWIKDGKFKYTPDVFIPLLEESGRISKLDEYLREKLCIKIRQWLDRGIKLPHFSVNVSRVELLQEEFISRLKFILTKYKIPPSMIHIELTETAYTDDQDHLASKIFELKESGFIIEMDDFGSGYSSLNVLKDIPVDVVKLDMKFIEKSTLTARTSNILISIINMAHSINLVTIAEGVETEEQVSYLEGIGCNYLQGYFFAKPMSTKDFECFLENNKIEASPYQPSDSM